MRFFIFSIFIVYLAYAEVPTVNVVGTAIIETQPNYSEIEIGAQSSDEKAQVSLNNVNNNITVLFNIINKYKIDSSLISLQKMDITQDHNYNDRNDCNKKPRYTATATYRIIIKDFNKLGPFINDCFNKGLNKLESITFKHNNMDSLQQVLSKLAIKNAEKNAKALVNGKLGNLIKVSYEKPDNYDVELYQSRSRRWEYGQGYGGAAGYANINIPILPSPIVIKLQIYASFEITQ